MTYLIRHSILLSRDISYSGVCSFSIENESSFCPFEGNWKLISFLIDLRINLILLMAQFLEIFLGVNLTFFLYIFCPCCKYDSLIYRLFRSLCWVKFCCQNRVNNFSSASFLFIVIIWERLVSQRSIGQFIFQVIFKVFFYPHVLPIDRNLVHLY